MSLATVELDNISWFHCSRGRGDWNIEFSDSDLRIWDSVFPSMRSIATHLTNASSLCGINSLSFICNTSVLLVGFLSQVIVLHDCGWEYAVMASYGITICAHWELPWSLPFQPPLYPRPKGCNGFCCRLHFVSSLAQVQWRILTSWECSTTDFSLATS